MLWVVVIARDRYGVEVFGPFDTADAATAWLDTAEAIPPGSCAIVPLQEAK